MYFVPQTKLFFLHIHPNIKMTFTITSHLHKLIEVSSWCVGYVLSADFIHCLVSAYYMPGQFFFLF